MSFASGYFKTSYAADLAMVQTRSRWAFLLALFIMLLGFPFWGTPFLVDRACEVFITLIGATALMLLTGYAGQISLGHAGFIAAGAFSTAILHQEAGVSILVALPAAGLVGGILGIIFGLPSLRLKGLYLALSTLALHFIVIYLGSEYETTRGDASGVIINPPSVAGITLEDPTAWYFFLLLTALAAIIFALNLVRSRTGRAWLAIRARDIVAESLGVNVPYYKLGAFLVSSVMTSMAGCLWAYYRGFVSVEAFSLFLSIEYIAMVIIGGLGSILGAILGTIFVVLLPYIIDAAGDLLEIPSRLETYMFAIKYASFGLIMIVFLIFEPLGLVGIWRRVRDYFVMWPFKHRPLAG